jgi:hypothetical protein
MMEIKQYMISFDGDELLVAEEPSGRYISMPSLCAALGLNVSGQTQRLQRLPDLTEKLKRLPLQTTGGQQRIWCLQSTAINAWLAGLRIGKTSRVSSEKIQRYRTHIEAWLEHATIQESITVRPSLPRQREVRPTPDLLPVDISAPVELHTQHPDEDALQQKMLEILSAMQSPALGTADTYITTTNSQIDQSIREASFATEWDQENVTYLASNNLEVYLGTLQKPLEITEAQAKLRQISGSTALTARVVLGLWNLRRHDQRLSLNGSAAIRLDEILAWRGIQKHTKTYAGTARRSDGYRTAQKQQIIRDLEILASCCVRGTVIVPVSPRRTRQLYVDGPYIQHAVVSAKAGQGEEVLGFFVAPGSWIHTFDSTTFRAEIDRRIFQLNPQNEQHELRLSLYLVEVWRQHALEQRHEEPFVMEELLAASTIDVDTLHMTRFVERIERALFVLWKRGLLGEPPKCLTPIDKSQSRWGKEWLASLWRLMPPRAVIERYTAWDTQQIPSWPASLGEDPKGG